MSKNKIPLIEVFGPTIQGEGSMCGFQTMFIRLGLCDYKCKMCDSMHAVDPLQVKQNATYMYTDEIAAKILPMMQEVEWVTISGGNPCLWDLSELIDCLQLAGKKVAIETQGTRWQDWLKKCDLVTISPKGPGMGEVFIEPFYQEFVDKLIKPAYIGDLDVKVCLKVVVFGDDDLQFAKDVYALTNCPELPLYLSLGNPILPGDTTSYADHVGILSRNYQCIAESLYKDPVLSKAIFLPQLHVLIWSNKQGV